MRDASDALEAEIKQFQVRATKATQAARQTDKAISDGLDVVDEYGSMTLEGARSAVGKELSWVQLADQGVYFLVVLPGLLVSLGWCMRACCESCWGRVASFEAYDVALAQAGLREGAVLSAPGGRGVRGSGRGGGPRGNPPGGAVIPPQCMPAAWVLVTLVRGVSYYALGLWALPLTWWPPLAADTLAIVSKSIMQASEKGDEQKGDGGVFAGAASDEGASHGSGLDTQPEPYR